MKTFKLFIILLFTFIIAFTTSILLDVSWFSRHLIRYFLLGFLIFLEMLIGALVFLEIIKEK